MIENRIQLLNVHKQHTNEKNEHHWKEIPIISCPPAIEPRIKHNRGDWIRPDELTEKFNSEFSNHVRNIEIF